MQRVRTAIATAALVWGASVGGAAADGPPDPQFLAVNAPLIAFTHITLMDGAGQPARKDMTVVVRGDRIAEVGPASAVTTPAGAEVIDGRGKTLTPGFVMMHEHPYYPTTTAGGRFGLYPHAFAQLNIAAGVTTLRTAGSLCPNCDLVVYRDVKARRTMGADMDVSGPLLDGNPPRVATVPVVHDADEARAVVEYWLRQGVTGFKVYQRSTLAEAEAAVKAAHAHGVKVAAHICSITADEASAIGIDSLEHGFATFNDFDPKTAAQCPTRGNRIVDMAPDAAPITALIDKLVARGTAITMTLQVGGVASGIIPVEPAALELLSPDLRRFYADTVEQARRPRDGRTPSNTQAFEVNARKLAALHQAFEKRGGLLMSGTDPTAPGVIPGFAAQREYKLMVRYGWAPADALKIMTLNGAKYLGREKEIGSIELGKRADLVLMDGDLSSDVTAIDRIETTFKAGVGYSRAKILTAYRGQINISDSYAFHSEDRH